MAETKIINIQTASIEGSAIRLADLRQLVTMTESWPEDCHVLPSTETSGQRDEYVTKRIVVNRHGS